MAARRTQITVQLGGLFRWTVFMVTLESEDMFWLKRLVSATRISPMAPSLSFIFFPAIAIDTSNGLRCLNSSVWPGTVPVT